MSRKLPIFYSALMLTGVNLLLRLVGTSFQVYLSSRIVLFGRDCCYARKPDCEHCPLTIWCN